MVQSLQPIVGQNPKILILGTMPGKESLRAERYYNHPMNRFWPFMFEYFCREFTDNYEIKKALLTSNGIALWDVIKHCERKDSSLDSAIKNSEPNDLDSFIKNNHIEAIFLNGKKAEKEYNKFFPILGIKIRSLPSTSPANCATSKKEQFNKWKSALDEFLLRRKL